MPKQYLQLSDFSGGLNTKFDARDLKQNEITVASNMQVCKPGQLFSSTASSEVTSRAAGTLVAGYGIKLFRSDTDLSNAALMLELLALADTNDSSDTKIDFFENPFNTTGMGTRDTTNFDDDTEEIDLGSGASANVIYYYVDGALRTSDAGSANVGSNTVNWYGYISRSSSAFDGQVDDWTSVANKLEAPVGTNCAITETGVPPVASNSGVGFDIDLTITTTDEDGLFESTTYEFAQSLVYEGDQETLLTTYPETVTLFSNNYFTNVYVGLKSSFDARVKGGRVYIRKEGSNDLWTLFVDIDFERGVRTDFGSQEYHGFSATSGAAYSFTSFTDATCDYNNDPTIAHDDDNGKIKVGMHVTGTGIPTLTSTVSSVTSVTSFELSASTTGGAVTNGTLTFISGLTIKGPSIDTYESINQFSPDVGHLSFGEAAGLYYKTATVCNMRTFVANVKYYKPDGGSLVKLMPDRLLYTPIHKYDTFPPNQFIDIGINDGEDFTALESFGTKLLAFKNNTLYIIDVTSSDDRAWSLESTHKGLGVDKPSAIVKTEFGICWARKTGIYAWHPTQGIIELSSKLDKNSAPMTALTNPVCGYYPPDNHLIVIQNCGASSDALIYDFETKSFTELGTYTSTSITNMQNNQDNCIWLEANSLKKYSSAQGQSAWSFETKDFDFGNPGVLKRPKKLVVSYSSTTNATITTTYYKDGDGTADSLNADTWLAAANGGVKTISLSGIGNVASLKLKFAGASVSGGCKINDITISYRTTRKEPSTGVN